MLIHSGKVHLYETICTQLILGYMLENFYSWKKVAAVYLFGVAFGELAAGAFNPWSFGYGGSGGVCGLWAAVAITTVCNRNKVRFSYFRYGYLAYELAGSVILSVGNFFNIKASYEAHLGGAFGGLVAAAMFMTPGRKRMRSVCKFMGEGFILVTVNIWLGKYIQHGESKIYDRTECVIGGIMEENSETWIEALVRVLK